MKKVNAILSAVIIMASSCGGSAEKKEIKQNDSSAAKNPATEVSTAYGQQIVLPAPFATKSVVNASKVIGWKDGQTPLAPAGFTVTKFADGLSSPRWIYVLPNGDVLVACASTEHKGIKKVKDLVSGKGRSVDNTGGENLIMCYHGINAAGVPQSSGIFLENLNQPFGMIVVDNNFYVANTDGIIMYPYTNGQTKITAPGKKIMDLPAGGYNNHWTRNLISNASGSKIYVTVGSGSNVAEHGIENEQNRADIIELNPDGTGARVYASGLRNPVGLGWAPGTNTLWTCVNERDELGNDLVPDYLTSVKDGGFYGWPYSYYGQHIDPRILAKDQKPDLVSRAIVPDVPMGSHTACLGLAFYNKQAFPAKYRGGAFIGEHGSWNRSTLAGYKVAFVPFQNGKAAGTPEDFLTGFIANGETSEVYGRPVGVAILPDGSILVADDAGNVVWRISANTK